MPSFDDYVFDVLLRDLVGHDHKPASFLVYAWLASAQQRRGGAIAVSYAGIAEAIGISKSSAQGAVAWLVGRKLLVSDKQRPTATPCYRVMHPWRRPRPERLSKGSEKN